MKISTLLANRHLGLVVKLRFRACFPCVSSSCRTAARCDGQSFVGVATCSELFPGNEALDCSARRDCSCGSCCAPKAVNLGSLAA